MVFNYKRKRVYRRKKPTMRKTYRKRGVGTKSYRKKGNFVKQFFKQPIRDGEGNDVIFTVTGGAGIETDDFTPSLENIANNDLTAYQSLYDEYRITRVGIMVKPRINQSDLSFPSFNMYSVVDKNDTASLVSVSQALEYNSCVQTSSRKGIYRTWVPSVTITNTDINGTTFKQEQKPQWISLQNANIAQPALKILTEGNVSSIDANFDLYVMIWAEFRTKL